MSLDLLKIKIRQKVENLLFERECPFGLYQHCFAKNYLCQNCSAKFLEADADFLAASKRPIYRKFEELEIYSVCLYRGLPREILQRLKWHSKQLAAPVAEIMQLFWKNYLLPKRADLSYSAIDYLLPVPSLLSSNRNWSPSYQLALFLSSLTKIRLLPRLLSKTQETKFYQLKLEERIRLSQESYIFNQSPKTKSLKREPKIVLIDDLCASGSTLRVCARLLEKNLKNPQITAITFASSGEPQTV